MKAGAATKEDARREFLLGCITLAIAAGYYLLAIRIPHSDIADVIGAQGLPKTYAALLAGLSVVLIARAVRARRTAADPPIVVARPDVPRGVTWRAVGMLLNGVVYVIVVPWLGYILSIALLVAATIYFQGGDLNRRSGAIAIGGGLFLWLLFVRLLHIAQPAGIWPSLR